MRYTKDDVHSPSTRPTVQESRTHRFSLGQCRYELSKYTRSRGTGRRSTHLKLLFAHTASSAPRSSCEQLLAAQEPQRAESARASWLAQSKHGLRPVWLPTAARRLRGSAAASSAHERKERKRELAIPRIRVWKVHVNALRRMERARLHGTEKSAPAWLHSNAWKRDVSR